jgi:hypothetical protein
VSTAYSNCDRVEVDETFYEVPINSNAVIDMTEKFPEEFLDQVRRIFRIFGIFGVEGL